MIAIIPARGQSKGIPRKNIKLLYGKPLIWYSINIAKQLFTEVYVSTEDKSIKAIAKGYGAKVLDRPDEFASDSATDYDWLKHAFSVISLNEFAILRPTTPIRELYIIQEAVITFTEHPECTSLRSSHEAPESPYKWFKLNKDGYYKKNRLADLPRQALPSVYIPNGYIDITRRSTIELEHSAFGDKILSFITQPVVEIDTQEEFDYLEYKLRTKHD